MADYILDVLKETNKLDWAMPFQRTGAFPLDRSALFSSLADANKYAAGDGTDERALGGASYVGQIISVYEAGDVGAYVIAADRSLVKLASTSATGDVAEDVSNLEAALDLLKESVEANAAAIEALTTRVEANEENISGLTDRVTANESGIESLNTALENVYTKSEADQKIGEAVAGAAHLKRIIIDSIDDIDVDAADALEYIYMVANGLEDDDNKYYEYIVIETADEKGNTARQVEQVGNWSVDLSDYATDEELEAVSGAVSSLANVVAGKADQSTTYTKTEVDEAIADALSAATGGESAADVLLALNNYKTSNDTRVLTIETSVASLETEVASLADAEKNFIASVNEDYFTVDAERKLDLNDLPVSKITNLETLLNAKADASTVEELQTFVNGLNSSVTDINALLDNKADKADLETLSGKVDNVLEILTWTDMEENE